MRLRTTLITLHVLLALRSGVALVTRSLFGQSEVRSNVAICIVGQLQRLELDSKVKNVFMPLNKKGHLVHAFVSVESDDEVVFNTNRSAADVTPNYTQRDVEVKLHHFFQTGSFHPHVAYKADPDRYIEGGYLWDKTEINSTAFRTARLERHFAEQNNLKNCVDMIEERESLLGIRYDVIIKIRDNTIVPRPYKLKSASDLDNNSQKGSVLVKNCCGWKGVNNKVMVLPREHLAVALGGVYAVLKGVEKGDPHMTARFARNKTIRNDEVLLQSVLQDYKVPVLKVHTDILPFVDGRCHSKDSTGKTSWCQVSDHKDCWPPQPWNIEIPKDCDFDVKDY